MFNRDRDLITELLTMEDVKFASLALFAVSMGPTVAAWEKGDLDTLRPFLRNGVVYARGCADMSCSICLV